MGYRICAVAILRLLKCTVSLATGLGTTIILHCCSDAGVELPED